MQQLKEALRFDIYSASISYHKHWKYSDKYTEMQILAKKVQRNHHAALAMQRKNQQTNLRK